MIYNNFPKKFYKVLLTFVILFLLIVFITCEPDNGDGGDSGDSGIEDVYDLDITVIPDEGGEVEINIDDSRQYGSNSILILTPQANDGFRFVNWAGDDSELLINNFDGSYELVMSKDISLTAYFGDIETADQVVLTVTPNNGGMVELFPEPLSVEENENVYIKGEEIKLSAVPEEDYDFIGWESIFLGGYEVDKTITLNGNITVEAIFIEESITLYTLLVETEPGATLSIDPEEIYYYSNEYIFMENELLTISVSDASCGSTFDGWGGDLSGESNPVELLMDSDKTIYAYTTQAFRLTLQYDSDYGSVDVDPIHIDLGGNMYKFKSEQEVTLTAQSEPGYQFASWEGDLSGNNNPETIIMKSDKTIHVEFSTE